MIQRHLPNLPPDERARRNATRGSGAVSPSDPAIAAAFAAFHRRAGFISAGASVRAFLTGGGWAFAGLALLSFAGGLFLARVSFNTPEHLITVAGHPPEMLYTKPQTTDIARSAAAAIPAAGAGETSIAAAAPPPLGEAENDTAVRRRDSSDRENLESELLAVASGAKGRLPDATANLEAALRLGAIGATQTNGRNGGDITVGYDAVELPSVPEPANGSIVAIGVAGLIGVTWLTRNRRRLRT